MSARSAVEDGPVLVFTRTFAAPRELVWQAWTDARHLGKWWGPDGFKTTVVTLDLRPGGAFVLDMEAPDGSHWPCRGVYRELKPPERLVYAGEQVENHPCGGGLPPNAIVTVSFDDEGDGTTTVTVHTRLATPEDLEAAVSHGFRQGWTDSLENLARALKTLAGEHSRL